MNFHSDIIDCSSQDSGRYRCQVGKESELLEFQVEVLGENSLPPLSNEYSSSHFDHNRISFLKGLTFERVVR